MNERMKAALVVFLALYLSVGGCLALLMGAAIPAISWPGKAYIAVAWPLFTKASPIHPPIPAWCFHFR